MSFRKYLLAIIVFIPASVLAMDLSLSVQPILPKQDILKAYQPLADYLSQKTGHNVTIRAHSNFLTYWADMRRQRGFDLVLDAAHFTDYRVNKMNYEVLAKIPDTVSFSIVTHEDNLVFDTEELVLKSLATLVSPSVGAIRILELFGDPVRQPKIVYAKNASDAASMVANKTAYAAIIPTALVGAFQGLNTVETTDSLPHMGFSAASDVPPAVRQQIRDALVKAQETPAGQQMLQQINFPAFEGASDKTYAGYNRLLQNVLGY
jgi:phosphonate transport system substrate-binding protein